MEEYRDPQKIRRDPEYLKQYLDKLMWDLANIAWHAPGTYNSDFLYGLISTILQELKDRQAIKDFMTHLGPSDDGGRCDVTVQWGASFYPWSWVVLILESGPQVGNGGPEERPEDVHAAMIRQREELAREQDQPTGNELKGVILNETVPCRTELRGDKVVFELGHDPTGKEFENWPTLEELLNRNRILFRRFERVTGAR